MNTAFSEPYTVEYSDLRNRIHTPAVVRYGKLSISVKAMWDTGAQLSCISKRAAEKLYLQPVGTTAIHGASGLVEVPIYNIDLLLPKENVFADLRVCEADMTEDAEDVIIGMNIIQLADFAITNSDGHTTFTYKFPSVHKTDYVREEHNAE